MSDKPSLRKSIENDERFHGMLGAWDHPSEDLPMMMKLFADHMPVEYRGWAEMIRGWAYRIIRERSEEIWPHGASGVASYEHTPEES